MPTNSTNGVMNKFLMCAVAMVALPLLAQEKGLLNLDGLQYSKGVRSDVNKDTKCNLGKADGNWPSLVEKKGK